MPSWIIFDLQQISMLLIDYHSQYIYIYAHILQCCIVVLMYIVLQTRWQTSDFVPQILGSFRDVVNGMNISCHAPWTTETSYEFGWFGRSLRWASWLHGLLRALYWQLSCTLEDWPPYWSPWSCANQTTKSPHPLGPGIFRNRRNHNFSVWAEVIS